MGIVVTPVNALVSRMRKAAPADPTTKKCPECLKRDSNRRTCDRLPAAHVSREVGL